MSEPKWLVTARKYLGVKEAPGAADNPQIIEWFDAVNIPVKKDSVAWCAVFVNGILAESNIAGTRSAAARSFLNWGKPTIPKPGAVMVFKRGSQAWQGHVAFYVGETATHYRVLGGNQGDKVSIASYPKSSLLGARWPATVGNSNTMAAGMTGGISTVLGFAGDMAQEALPLAQEATDWIDVAKYACFGLGIVMFIVIMWRRYQKMKAGK